MRVKYTPGPWTEGERLPAKGWALDLAAIRGPNGELICMQSYPDWTEQTANRHLITAAPDLLAACKAALFPAGDTPQQVRDQLLAAIRKAEGTQP